jgi:hypothetical protein
LVVAEDVHWFDPSGGVVKKDPLLLRAVWPPGYGFIGGEMISDCEHSDRFTP